MESRETESKCGPGRPRKEQFKDLKFDEAQELLGSFKRGRPRRTLHQINDLAAFKCPRCSKILPISEFAVLNPQKFYFSSVCVQCCNHVVKENQNNQDPISKRVAAIKKQARRNQTPIDSNIEMSVRKLWAKFHLDTARCAYTGKPLDLCASQPSDEHYWTVDRLVPEMGYVQGNMVLVTNVVHQMKRDMTIDLYVKTCLDVVTWFGHRGLASYMRNMEAHKLTDEEPVSG